VVNFSAKRRRKEEGKRKKKENVMHIKLRGAWGGIR
jgi:hypothetical protein